MTAPKRHHYLPQFYLRGFCRDDSFWVFDRGKGEFRVQTPINTTVQTHYYSYRKKDGSLDPTLENLISQVEGSVAPIIEKLGQGDVISLEEKQTISLFAGLQANRVPDAKKRHEEIRQGILDRLGDNIAPATDEEIAEAQSVVPPEQAGPRVSAYELVQNLREFEMNAELAHNDFLKVILPISLRIAERLFQMTWLIAHVPDDTNYITTDNPFITISPGGFDPEGPTGYGIGTPGAVKLFPLSSRSCLFVLDHGTQFGHTIVGSDVAREINHRLAVMCDRYLIASEEEQARRIVSNSGIDTSKRGPRINIE